jgi:RNA polymerase sigma-70 factor (sigma-E family)
VVDDPPGAVEFCRRLQPRLLGALALHCGDADLAEELTQETLARVWDRWPRVTAMAAPERYAFRVGFNLANSTFRRRAAERRARMRAVAAADPPGDALDRTDAIAVRAAVAGLPPRQRAAVVLRYFADLSVAETAAAMGCAQGTIKALTSQGLGTLRARGGLTEFQETRDGA